MNTRHATLWSFAWLCLIPSVAVSDTGTIRGHTLDKSGRAAYVGRAVVFLADAESGMPILSTTKQPLIPKLGMDDLEHLWHAVTSERGEFEFRDVPVGRYRLVVQSWAGLQGLPALDSKPSTVVVLHGVADNVHVQAGETTDAYPQQLGEGVLKIVNDPEEAHAFLLISRHPRLGDGVLGPAAWGTRFLTGLIGVTQMEKPYVTLVGLPEGAEIHVGLFNYDNNPGVGGDSYTVGEQPEVRLRIFATWSNGQYEPPPRLAKLTDYLEAEEVSVPQLLNLQGTDSENRQALYERMRSEPDQQVEVPDLGTYRLIDIAAAKAYAQLRAFHRQRGR